MPPPLSSPRGRQRALRRRADGNVAVVSHGQHVLTPTAAAAWRVNTAVSSVREYVFYVFFQISKKHDFLRFFEMTYQKVVKSL